MGSERPGPLQLLAETLLSAAPPRIAALIERISPDEAAYFRRLVRTFLPEHEHEVLSQEDVSSAVATFANRFRDRYFPLNAWIESGDVESYGEILDHIPLVVQTIDYDQYHDDLPEWRLGLRMMSFVVADPYQGTGGEGGRVPLGESCRETVDLHLLMQVPDAGVSREALHAALDGSPYEGLAVWADMLFAETGNFFLDTDPESLMNGHIWANWEMDEVKQLTRQWKQSELLHQRVTRTADAVEKDPEAWLAGVLDYLKQKGALHHGDGDVGQAEGAQMGVAGVAAGAAGPPPGQIRLF